MLSWGTHTYEMRLFVSRVDAKTMLEINSQAESAGPNNHVQSWAWASRRSILKLDLRPHIRAAMMLLDTLSHTPVRNESEWKVLNMATPHVLKRGDPLPGTARDSPADTTTATAITPPATTAPAAAATTVTASTSASAVSSAAAAAGPHESQEDDDESATTSESEEEDEDDSSEESGDEDESEHETGASKQNAKTCHTEHDGLGQPSSAARDKIEPSSGAPLGRMTNCACWHSSIPSPNWISCVACGVPMCSDCEFPPRAGHEKYLRSDVIAEAVAAKQKGTLGVYHRMCWHRCHGQDSPAP